MDAIPRLIHSADLRIYYLFSSFASNWFLARLARFEEENNLLKGGVFFALYWHIWFRTGSDRENRRKTILTVLIAAVLSIVAVRTIAFVTPFRVRPMDDPALVHPSFPIQVQYNLEHWNSFPSDTAAYFCALAFGIAFLSRRLAVPIALYTSIWICLIRIYLGIHYASDIVVGAAIGIAMAWISLKSNLLRPIVRRITLAADAFPERFYPIAFLVSFQMATVFAGLRNLGNAAIHTVGIGLHIRFLHSYSNSPIGVWGGLVAIVGSAAIGVWITSASSGKMRNARATVRGIDSHLGPASRLQRK